MLTLFISIGSWIVSFAVGLAVLPRALSPGSAPLALAAALSAAVSIGRSPASAISVLRETRSVGVFSTVSLGVVIAKDFVLFLVFAVTEGIARAARGTPLDAAGLGGGVAYDSHITNATKDATAALTANATAEQHAAFALNASTAGKGLFAGNVSGAAGSFLVGNVSGAASGLFAGNASAASGFGAALGGAGADGSLLSDAVSNVTIAGNASSRALLALSRPDFVALQTPISSFSARSLLSTGTGVTSLLPPHSPLRPTLLALCSALAAVVAGAAAGAALPYALHALGLASVVAGGAAGSGSAAASASGSSAVSPPLTAGSWRVLRLRAAASRVDAAVRARAATWRAAAGLGGRRWAGEGLGSGSGGGGGSGGGAASGGGVTFALTSLARTAAQGVACVSLACVGPFPHSVADGTGTGSGAREPREGSAHGAAPALPGSAGFAASLPPPPPLLASCLAAMPPASGGSSAGPAATLGGGFPGAFAPSRLPAALAHALRLDRAVLSRLAGRLAPPPPRGHGRVRRLLSPLSPARVLATLLSLAAAVIWLCCAAATRLALHFRSCLPSAPPLAALTPAAVARAAYGLGLVLGVEPLLCTVSAGASYAAAASVWAAQTPVRAKGAARVEGARASTALANLPAPPTEPTAASAAEIPAALMAWANVLFFSLAGARIDLGAVLGAREVALALFAARIAGIFLGARAGVLTLALLRRGGEWRASRSVLRRRAGGTGRRGTGVPIAHRPAARAGARPTGHPTGEPNEGDLSGVTGKRQLDGRSTGTSTGTDPQLFLRRGPAGAWGAAEAGGNGGGHGGSIFEDEPTSSQTPQSPPGLSRGAGSGGGFHGLSNAIRTDDVSCSSESAHPGRSALPPGAETGAAGTPTGDARLSPTRSLSACSSAPPSPFASTSPGSPAWLGGIAAENAKTAADRSSHPEAPADASTPSGDATGVPELSPASPIPQRRLPTQRSPTPDFVTLPELLSPGPEETAADYEASGVDETTSRLSPLPPQTFDRSASGASSAHASAGRGVGATVLLLDTPTKMYHVDDSASTPAALRSASSLGRRGSDGRGGRPAGSLAHASSADAWAAGSVLAHRGSLRGQDSFAAALAAVHAGAPADAARAAGTAAGAPPPDAGRRPADPGADPAGEEDRAKGALAPVAEQDDELLADLSAEECSRKAPGARDPDPASREPLPGGPVTDSSSLLGRLPAPDAAAAAAAASLQQAPLPASFGNLWLSMLTQAGVTLGLVDEVRRAFPEWGKAWASAQTAVVLLNLAVGPLAYRYALHAAGETEVDGATAKDRPGKTKLSVEESGSESLV